MNTVKITVKQMIELLPFNAIFSDVDVCQLSECEIDDKNAAVELTLGSPWSDDGTFEQEIGGEVEGVRVNYIFATEQHVTDFLSAIA